ncbi:hypothetical protein TNCV_1322281 [Trichonephila clavipes]|nr:hypothetical protein TNCV_1322281 [Trichonephila clavipes]
MIIGARLDGAFVSRTANFMDILKTNMSWVMAAYTKLERLQIKAHEHYFELIIADEAKGKERHKEIFQVFISAGIAVFQQILETIRLQTTSFNRQARLQEHHLTLIIVFLSHSPLIRQISRLSASQSVGSVLAHSGSSLLQSSKIREKPKSTLYQRPFLSLGLPVGQGSKFLTIHLCNFFPAIRNMGRIFLTFVGLLPQQLEKRDRVHHKLNSATLIFTHSPPIKIQEFVLEQKIPCTGAGGRHPFCHDRRVDRPCQQPGQGSEGRLPKSHVQWLGESKQQPRLSLRVSGLDPMTSFLWLSKTLFFGGHGSIFVNVCGNNALCSSEGEGYFRLRRFG